MKYGIFEEQIYKISKIYLLEIKFRKNHGVRHNEIIFNMYKFYNIKLNDLF